MKLPGFFCTVLVFFIVNANAQLQTSANTISSETPKKYTNITHSDDSDSALFKVEMIGALYDFSKQQLPFYLVSNPTPRDMKAIPSLLVKEARPVSETHSAVIKRYYAKYLSNRFEITAAPTTKSKGENMNLFRIVPFRINGLNQVEELVDYSLSWESSPDETPAAQMRGASGFKSGSVLASGSWYKLGVTQSGVYKLDKTFLNQLGINTSKLDPTKIRVFGNGGKMVPERNKDFRYDDLEETAIIVSTPNDKTFDNSSYVLFYATGTTEWKNTNSKTGLKFEATTSLYSDTSFYFLNIDQENGKRMQKAASSPKPFTSFTNTYDYYNYHELNTTNFGKSGREFYGEYFDITTSYGFKWNDGNFVNNDTLISEVSVVAKYSDSVRFSVSCGNSSYLVSTRGLNFNNQHEDYAAPGARTYKNLMIGSSEINLTVSKLTQKSLGWLNKVTVNARRYLAISGKQFLFRDTRSSGPGNICHFSLTNSGSSPLLLLNVSDPVNAFIQDYTVSGESVGFNAAADSVNEYCAFPQNDFYTPTYVGRVANQNLHGKQQADLVIISHPLFLKEAERLGAFHQQLDGLSYVVASIEEIYNEFGSGKQDPAAIRDFIRMLYSRNLSTGKEVKYVVLVGDGSYINKNRGLLNNSNYIPTYESIESLSETMSVATDDFYGMMDDDEGVNAENYGGVDIGVGRFTCRMSTEVKGVVDKIVNYCKKDPGFKASDTENSAANSSVMGDWRNWLIFLADDEDEALHMTQADQLSGTVSSINPFCNFDKIYLDAYQRYSTPGGLRYPDATIDVVKRIKKGALVFNYTGHGGEVGLTAERMIDIDIINSLDNFNRLPLFITATCEFSRYDDPGRTSAGELCLLNPNGAAIGLFTTCRLAFSSSNFTLNTFLLEYMFKKLPSGKRPRLGDIIRLTKARTGQSLIANFHLLGDPALTLAYPEMKVITSKINNRPLISTNPDTLSALSKISIGGYIADTSGNKLSNFNGVVYPTVFDKEQTVSCLINSEYSAINYPPSDSSKLLPFKYKSQKNVLFSGKIEVVNGDFSFSFLVPKDISFAPGPGRVSYYATNGTTDANGNYTRLVVGGTSTNVVIDNEGPKIDLYLNDKSFVSGGITNESPILHANLSDSSGINTVGTGIGHDISVVLDQNTSKPVVLNDYYEANLNSYQSGKVRYPFADLSEGNHRLTFKAWDIQNNSSVVNADFVVARTADIALQHVLNYPNPFTTHTKFMFQHNQGCNPLKVTVQVYTISGKLVKTLQKSVSCDDTGPQGVEWDGKDDYGDKLGKGVYIYKLAIIDVENKKAEKIEKLVILN